MIVSVVIPTYRRRELLYNCIKALLLQKFDKTQFEIIVVSDGPDELTEKIFDEWTGYDFPLMRYLPMPEKKGPAAARNHGWLNAHGQIIAFTDDDCLPDSHWLNEIVSHCNPEQAIAITGKVIVPVGKRPTDHEKNTANLETADFITANCACTKNALLKAGGFDEQFSMAWREDSDLEFKLITNNVRILKVDRAIVVHPVRKSSWGVSIREQKKTMYNALLYKKHPLLYRKKINAQTPIFYYALITGFLIMIFGFLFNQDTSALAGLTIWASMTAFFAVKRLYATSLTITHITEMIVTSIFIPFLSVFWQWYGAIKYRVLFI